MLRRLGRSPLSVFAFAAACTYTQPDLRGVPFRCDLEHPCPDGIECVDSICGKTPSIDAAPPLGPSCGAVTCAPPMECCDGVAGGFRCQAHGQACDGVVTTCDGPEDCPGKECCIIGIQGTCTATGTCLAISCHVDDDCKGALGKCCPAPPLAWKRCAISC